jgi:hypothetical protein
LQLKEIACKKYQIDAEKARIWNFFDPSTAKVLEEDSTLEDCTVVNEQKLLVESQLANGTWPRETQAGEVPDTDAVPNGNEPSPTQAKAPEPVSKVHMYWRSIDNLVIFQV